MLLRLGELVAYAECAGALARRAAAAAAGALPDKADRRFEPRRAGRGQPGLRPGGGAQGRRGGPALGGRARAPGADLAAALPLERVRAAQAGLLADMDAVADALYATRRPDHS